MAAGEDERLLLQVGVQRLHQRPAQGLAHHAALFGGLAGDPPLDLEQLIDPANHLQSDGRHGDGRLALRLAPGGLLKIGEDEERTARVGPAGGLKDRPRLAIRRVQTAIAAEGVGLEHARPSRQMALGMLASAIA